MAIAITVITSLLSATSILAGFITAVLLKDPFPVAGTAATLALATYTLGHTGMILAGRMAGWGPAKAYGNRFTSAVLGMNAGLAAALVI